MTRPASEDMSTLASTGADEDTRLPQLTYVLSVVQGPDAGARFELDASQPSLLLGQGPACPLRLTDRQISRRHAALEVTARGVRISDLGSMNGTFVNGAQISEALLRGGETVHIGQTALAIVRGPDAARPLATALRFGGMIGKSPQMRRLYPLCERLAASDIPVVIEGETGTGKEVLAEAIHQASPRASAPFVLYDCTAVPPNLVESALFGHERGAFTGATNQRRGVFEQADGGTLFIDEIGELELSLQPKLLRALQRGEVQRVGGTAWTRVDVRVIAATRRDLDREVQEGRFRDDLFFRLAVGRIELPPLRERTGDVTLLARHFVRELGGDERTLPPGLFARLESYAWPGNVRELENTLAKVIALGDLAEHGVAVDDAEPVTGTPPRDEASTEGAPDAIARVLAQDLPLTRARQLVVEEFERQYVKRVLDRSGGNVARAARASGLARRYFQMLRARRTS